MGIPAELLLRRPDVRRALREAAAQSAQIGVAEADFYPRIGVSGFIGYAAGRYPPACSNREDLPAMILPSFQWKILNYGRILNNVRKQDARLQEKVFQYQQTVLKAGQEVEDALVGFLQSQLQARSLPRRREARNRIPWSWCWRNTRKGLSISTGSSPQSQLLTQQDQLAIARGNIASSLIAVYRALGGGWQAVEKC